MALDWLVARINVRISKTLVSNDVYLDDFFHPLFHLYDPQYSGYRLLLFES